jgi:hypothetical protein
LLGQESGAEHIDIGGNRFVHGNDSTTIVSRRTRDLFCP